MDELTKILFTAGATAIFSTLGSLLALAALGPRTAAELTQRRAIQDREQTRERIGAAIRADIELASRVAHHNAASADDPGNDRPRAFIALQVNRYQDLLFQGADPRLIQPLVLDALVTYLAQAQHVNEMIALFESLEVQTSGISGAPLAGKKSQYVQALGVYCRDEVPQLLTRLQHALDQAQNTP